MGSNRNDAELLSTTALCQRLGIQVTAALLIEIGCKPFCSDGGCHWWDEDDYLEICDALAQFIAEGGRYFK